MANIVRQLSVHKEHEFLAKLESAGLNDDLAQVVIGSKGNKKAKELVELLRNGGSSSVQQSNPKVLEFVTTLEVQGREKFVAKVHFEKGQGNGVVI